MVFTSLPTYLDPPNWHQHQNHQSGSIITVENMQQLPPPQPQSLIGGDTNSMRLNSMSDRGGRVTKLPHPETALKCPRCESMNTKFCYFNNYSLSQPRHFCKTCRRYWTRGGALRSVPVGGGCRRNKKSKTTCSKSSTTTASENPKGSTSSTTSLLPSSSFTSDAISHMHPQLPHFPFMNSLHHHLTDYAAANDMNLNFCSIPTPILPTAPTGNINSHIEIESSRDGNGIITSNGEGGGAEQWRLQQFPFLAGMDTQTGLYTFGEGVEVMGGGGGEILRGKPSASASVITQVKTEENQGFNISRPLLDIARNDQYWGSGNGWTDLSGLTSSSTNLN